MWVQSHACRKFSVLSSPRKARGRNTEVLTERFQRTKNDMQKICCVTFLVGTRCARTNTDQNIYFWEENIHAVSTSPKYLKTVHVAHRTSILKNSAFIFLECHIDHFLACSNFCKNCSFRNLGRENKLKFTF